MVLESEENIKLLIDARKKPRTPEWAVDWRDVEGSTFAIVFPDVKGKLVKKLAIDKFESENHGRVARDQIVFVLEDDYNDFDEDDDEDLDH